MCCLISVSRLRRKIQLDTIVLTDVRVGETPRYEREASLSRSGLAGESVIPAWIPIAIDYQTNDASVGTKSDALTITSVHAGRANIVCRGPIDSIELIIELKLHLRVCSRLYEW